MNNSFIYTILTYLLADYRRYELAQCEVDHTQVHGRTP